MRTTRNSWIGLIALTAILSGCSSDGDRDSDRMHGDNGTSKMREGAKVEMTASHAFSPREVTIRAGESLTWRNSSKEPHTVTLDSSKVARRDSIAMPAGAKPFDSGELAPGKTWRQTFTVPGTYRYVCRLHEEHGMTGTVVVRPSDSGAPSPY